MNRRGLLVALMLAAACTMPPLAEGQQLACEVDDQCPEGSRCDSLCCVKEGERPLCRGAEEDARSVGLPCTGGCADLTCTGSCPGSLICYDEELTGLPSGFCTLRCVADECKQGTSCRGVPGIQPEGTRLCAPQCWFNPQNGCRDGYRCDCSPGGSCSCLPVCTESSCAPGFTGDDGKRCDASTNLCKVAPGS